MNRDVYWLLELAVQGGRLDDFRALMTVMVDAARAEPGTLNYEWSISADGAMCHVYVRYQDSSAVMAHMHAFGDRFSARFLSLARITGMTVYGAPDERVKRALEPYGARYLQPFGGFSRGLPNP